MKKTELYVGRTVAQVIQIGTGLTKRHLGVITEVGHKGARIEWLDRTRGAMWLRAGQLTAIEDLPTVQVHAVEFDRPKRFFSNAVYVANDLEAMADPLPPDEPEPTPQPSQEAPSVPDKKTLPADAILPDLSSLERAGLDPWAMYVALGNQLRERAGAKVRAAEDRLQARTKDVEDCVKLLEQARHDEEEARELLRAAHAEMAAKMGSVA